MCCQEVRKTPRLLAVKVPIPFKWRKTQRKCWNHAWGHHAHDIHMGRPRGDPCAGGGVRLSVLLLSEVAPFRVGSESPSTGLNVFPPT